MRLDDIKERLNKYKAGQGYANQRTPNMVSLRRELIADFEQNSTSDMEYLLSKLETAEQALEDIFLIDKMLYSPTEIKEKARKALNK